MADLTLVPGVSSFRTSQEVKRFKDDDDLQKIQIGNSSTTRVHASNSSTPNFINVFHWEIQLFKTLSLGKDNPQMKFTLEKPTGTKRVHAQSSHFSKLASMMPFDLEIGCEEDDAELCNPHYIKFPRVKKGILCVPWIEQWCGLCSLL